MESQKRVRIIFVMIDGLGDHSHQYGEEMRTPLQAAHTPNMDWLAQQNMLGLHDPVQNGLACGSDTAHMSIFGYDPLKLYDGRGSFESMGAGLEMKVGDIAFKSNFAFMDIESGKVLLRRVDRTFADWGVELCDALNNLKLDEYPDHVVKCMHATEHRCGILISGPSLSSQITGTDPLKDNLPLVVCKAEDESDEQAVFTAKLTNAVSKKITQTLLEHPLCVKRKSQG